MFGEKRGIHTMLLVNIISREIIETENQLPQHEQRTIVLPEKEA